ncbi:unknown protein [Azorhizobium caulinodans ORS 571]|uniref:Uncharacterized protein n=1 Tax=Azorhizobium caulinodans (strain ATCC 43989 / DSM 5975 / JCM 20966 / LMG 6465 / NBRC 14845 / NCIMB 13405 / ORS 571) TaxID=438753 RepID=A8HVT1_AZOC5|nr:hypothetical protein [Azorhizobium caulinodans]BAF90352.1 unknown protein [Azorhizobium caulinodans ORS 571]
MSLSIARDTPMWPFTRRFSHDDRPARADMSAHDTIPDDLREEVAALVYERFFPDLIWGDASTSGRSSAYASADAILSVLEARGLVRPERR